MGWQTTICKNATGVIKSSLVFPFWSNFEVQKLSDIVYFRLLCLTVMLL